MTSTPTLSTSLFRQDVTMDEGTCASYSFTLGKLYGFKRPRFYSTENSNMTFYCAESLYPPIKKSPAAFFLNKKEVMIYVGYINATNIPVKGYQDICKIIPCFLYNNTFVLPEPFVVNNPTMFFVQL